MADQDLTRTRGLWLIETAGRSGRVELTSRGDRRVAIRERPLSLVTGLHLAQRTRLPATVRPG
jgi:hypothetical protein